MKEKKVRLNVKSSNGNARRRLMFAAKAASVYFVAGIGHCNGNKKAKRRHPKSQ